MGGGGGGGGGVGGGYCNRKHNIKCNPFDRVRAVRSSV